MEKTSREWLDEIQSKIHLVIDLNAEPCGWNLNNFSHSFHNEQITLKEFKERIKKSIIECNIIEINDWLNNSSKKTI